MTEQNNSEPNTTKTPAKVYPTKDEATAANPNKPRVKLFEVVKDGQSIGFCWSDGYTGAITLAARMHGYAARLADRKGGGFVTAEMLRSRLAAFTDEELSELGLMRGSKLADRKGGKK